MSINCVYLLGSVGRVDVKEVGGTKVSTLSIATSERFKNRDGEYVENTTWHNVVVWGRTAEFVEANVAKGCQVFVEGKIQKRKYTDKNGEEREVVEVRAESLQLISKPEVRSESRRERQDYTPAQRTTAKPAPKPVDDLPEDIEPLPF